MFQSRYWVRNKAGAYVWFESIADVIRDPADGKPAKCIGLSRSINEQMLAQESERKYLQAQKMEAVGQMTGGIAHDFNNLLMVVKGNLQLVESAVKNDERSLKRMQAVYEAAEKGLELTRRMLAFSRQQTLQNKLLDMNELVAGMSAILGRAVGETVDMAIAPCADL